MWCCHVTALTVTLGVEALVLHATGEGNVARPDLGSGSDQPFRMIVGTVGGNDRLDVKSNDSRVIKSLAHRTRRRIGPRGPVEPNAARRPARRGRNLDHSLGRKRGMHARS